MNLQDRYQAYEADLELDRRQKQHQGDEALAKQVEEMRKLVIPIRSSVGGVK